MEKIDKLQSQARILHALLARHALTDIHAAMVLEFMLRCLGRSRRALLFPLKNLNSGGISGVPTRRLQGSMI
jgi:hypothetical protein